MLLPAFRRTSYVCELYVDVCGVPMLTPLPLPATKFLKCKRRLRMYIFNSNYGHKQVVAASVGGVLGVYAYALSAMLFACVLMQVFASNFQFSQISFHKFLISRIIFFILQYLFESVAVCGYTYMYTDFLWSRLSLQIPVWFCGLLFDMWE